MAGATDSSARQATAALAARSRGDRCAEVESCRRCGPRIDVPRETGPVLRPSGLPVHSTRRRAAFTSPAATRLCRWSKPAFHASLCSKGDDRIVLESRPALRRLAIAARRAADATWSGEPGALGDDLTTAREWPDVRGIASRECRRPRRGVRDSAFPGSAPCLADLPERQLSQADLLAAGEGAQ